MGTSRLVLRLYSCGAGPPCSTQLMHNPLSGRLRHFAPKHLPLVLGTLASGSDLVGFVVGVDRVVLFLEERHARHAREEKCDEERRRDRPDRRAGQREGPEGPPYHHLAEVIGVPREAPEPHSARALLVAR